MKVAKIPIRTLMEADVRRRGPVRYLDLPFELRQHILSFTDLVASTKNAFWRNKRLPHFFMGLCLRKPDCENEFCCQTCCEGIYHTMFPPCQCFYPPQSLFQVCRRMAEDARQVFYSSNTFVLYESRQEDPVKLEPLQHGRTQEMGRFRGPPTFQAFLTKTVPLHCYQYLQRICFTLEFHEYYDISPSAMQTWQESLENYGKHMGRLHLDLGLEISRDMTDREPFSQGWHPNRVQPPPTEQFAAQVRIVKPLQQLTRLQSLIIRMDPHRYCYKCPELREQER